ncbi:MAG: DNA-directed RNA polymerase subunit beta [Eubacteriales bacterium]
MTYKVKVHEVPSGQRVRKTFASIKEVLEMPDLIDIQKESYAQFLESGLREVLKDISPINDYSDTLTLELIDYTIDEEPKYSVAECKERDVTYSAPLRMKVRLINRETGEIKESEVFMGEFPLMTETGTFIINGAERVIVSQLVRSPGVIFGSDIDKNGNPLFTSTVIPNRGAWLEFESDANSVMWIRVDRTRKQPATVILRALDYGTDAQITELVGEDPRILATLSKDNAKTKEEGLVEIYKRLRPGEPPAVESATSLINSLFFDDRRYDLARVGRYKFNTKLSLKNRIAGKIAAEDVVNEETGEVFVKKGEKIHSDIALDIQNSGIQSVSIALDSSVVKVLGNRFVDPRVYLEPLGLNAKELGLNENVHYPTLKEILDEYKGKKDEMAESIKENTNLLIPRHIHRDDIIAAFSYYMGLFHGIGSTDDIDHLGNRRIRSVGELLQNQMRIGLTRLERVVRERMGTQDLETVTPQALINIRPVTAAIKEFFGSSQLSHFMDQTNPLAELTNKRRLSALGPGGLNRDRATLDVRDVHSSHYGRMCPVETPEGPNIGLIGSLAIYSRINKYGFIETPYRKVDKKKGIVTDEVEYMTADVEDNYVIAQANEPTDEKGHFVNDHIAARVYGKIMEIRSSQVDYMDVSPKQVVSVATAMIPFLENDDASRALMGSNMQRQAVPLLIPEAPFIGTGMEDKTAYDSGVIATARCAGVVERVSASEILIKDQNGQRHRHALNKFQRSNQGTCINQHPLVKQGEKVKKGDIIADGPSTEMGELALGRNILVGFMPWEGYNFEDAILLSEKLVKDDVLTSIHIEEYECEARDTKLGPEEITREVPNVGEDALKELNERGIIRVGAEVKAGDILVGKVTPKGETELNPEERLLRAIFGEKVREVRDTSLKVPHGENGIIIDVKTFTRENHDEMKPGVNEMVRVYIAQRRKISVGDKMAGRHGNKGVVSRILPAEDMPYMADGTPLEIVLNPLGVPSRMNIGQVLEIHLGLLAKKKGWHIATPVFDGAHEEDIQALFVEEDMDPSGKMMLRDGRTGEFFENPVTVGYMYMLKLIHLVDDKIHARATGPYSLITQQPLGGKAQFGGQRFGEMEVWALEAYGAAYTLQEILTVKSDDVVGRVKTYEAIVKGENVPEPGIPESFKVLIKELQSLALDMSMLSENNQEIDMKETDYNDEPDDFLDVNIEGEEESLDFDDDFGDLTLGDLEDLPSFDDEDDEDDTDDDDIDIDIEKLLDLDSDEDEEE